MSENWTTFWFLSKCTTFLQGTYVTMNSYTGCFCHLQELVLSFELYGFQTETRQVGLTGVGEIWGKILL